MIKNDFYYCPKGHKLQQITETSTHIGTFYCRHCGVHYPVNIVNGVEASKGSYITNIFKAKSEQERKMDYEKAQEDNKLIRRTNF